MNDYENDESLQILNKDLDNATKRNLLIQAGIKNLKGDFEKQVESLCIEMGLSPNEIASVLEELANLGLDGAQKNNAEHKKEKTENGLNR